VNEYHFIIIKIKNNSEIKFIKSEFVKSELCIKREKNQNIFTTFRKKVLNVKSELILNQNSALKFTIPEKVYLNYNYNFPEKPFIRIYLQLSEKKVLV